jgi:hypothetical protein
MSQFGPMKGLEQVQLPLLCNPSSHLPRPPQGFSPPGHAISNNTLIVWYRYERLVATDQLSRRIYDTTTRKRNQFSSPLTSEREQEQKHYLDNLDHRNSCNILRPWFGSYSETGIRYIFLDRHTKHSYPRTKQRKGFVSASSEYDSNNPIKLVTQIYKWFDRKQLIYLPLK